MHQSPQKQPAGRRRDKYADAVFELLDSDAEAERRLLRGHQPKARKFQLREDGLREEPGRTHPRG